MCLRTDGWERLVTDDRDYVQSLVRGLDVIRAFSRHAPRMTLSDVARRTGLTRAAARRFLLTLVAEHYAETDGKHFTLRPKVLDLGFAYLSSMSLWEVALPIMREVVEAAKESCSTSVLDGLDIVYVARVPTQRVMTISLSVGSRLPAHVTSMGRVLLAGLDPADLEERLARLQPERLTDKTITDRRRLRERIAEVREQGWAIVDQELELGLRSIAVPIVNRTGTVIAALNIGCHAGRVSIDDMLTRFLPPLQAASRKITDSLPG
jgi:IclR family pca regulon transcriptional regulator